MRDTLFSIIMWGVIILLVLIALAFLVLVIYVQIKYWNTPVGELPAWVFRITK